MKNNLLNKRTIVIGIDLFLIIISYFLAFFLRFEMTIPAEEFQIMLLTLPIVVILRMACFWLFGLYKGMWHFASAEDLVSILKAISTSSVLIVLTLYIINQFVGYPRSVFFIDWLLLVMLVGGFRFSIRLSKEIMQSSNGMGKRILIVGAGNAGESILREMNKKRDLNYNPVGLIDDDPQKKGQKLHGVKVLGNRKDIPAVVSDYSIDEIIISIPSATNEQIKGIIEYCIESGAKFKTIPALIEIMDGKVSVGQIRDVQMEDLLGRDPVELDLERIKDEFMGKRVLVTGGGGSIGRELCKQISRYKPEKLILFDHNENSVFYTDRDLKSDFPSLDCVPVVADVSDRKLTSQILMKYKPRIIFHAAAHKHVPLMELNVAEVVRNNVLGTKVIADLAIQNSVDKFIFISTDKAVNPTSFMGATKRFGELYAQSLNKTNHTKFMSVRFGNVIGSTGSVARLFKEQIQFGRPVTVTHPEIARFLMTIPEAVQLILEATSLGQGGEIFVLDMGEPIKIMELARTMIRLSGYEPEKDVPIIITGLRPGEKMKEELFDKDSEKLDQTKHKKIFTVESVNHKDSSSVLDELSELEFSFQNLEDKDIIGKLQRLLRTEFSET